MGEGKSWRNYTTSSSSFPLLRVVDKHKLSTVRVGVGEHSFVRSFNRWLARSIIHSLEPRAALEQIKFENGISNGADNR